MCTRVLKTGTQWILARSLLQCVAESASAVQSMNTVMDDNRMLTLASNERIPLTPSMGLLLEISHMNHCSPATVSRGGVIYVNATDIGWKPVRPTWPLSSNIGTPGKHLCFPVA